MSNSKGNAVKAIFSQHMNVYINADNKPDLIAFIKFIFFICINNIDAFTCARILLCSFYVFLVIRTNFIGFLWSVCSLLIPSFDVTTFFHQNHRALLLTSCKFVRNHENLAAKYYLESFCIILDCTVQTLHPRIRLRWNLLPACVVIVSKTNE